MEVGWQYFANAAAEEDICHWMQNWRSLHPQGGLLALVAERSKDAIPVLQGSACDLSLPLVGAMFPELVVQDAFCKEGLLLCGLDPMPAFHLAGGLSEGLQHQAAVDSLTGLIDENWHGGTLLLFFDGMYGRIATFLDDLFGTLWDECRYAGVNAGSETFQPMPCLFDQERWIGDSVLALALPGNPGAELAHGYSVPDEIRVASATTGNRVAKIDLRPAFDVYADLIRKHYGQEVTRESFYSLGVHFPFALTRADGQILIRIPVAVDDEGALFCVGEIPDGSLLTVARAIEPGNTQAVQELLRIPELRQASDILFFYCAGRRMHLGDEAVTEMQVFSQRVQGRRIMGALSLGEIGNSHSGGYPLFHNATLVALPLRVPT